MPDVNATPKSARRIAPMLAIALAGILVYSNTFQVPFVFDDYIRIVENAAIRTLWPPTVAMANSNRPFATWTFAINYAVHGKEVWGYHALNLAIHIGAGQLLFGVVRRSLLRVGGALQEHAGAVALVVALIWVVHPLQTQAVTYIVQRLESLMGMAYLATVYCFIRAEDSRSPRPWYAASVLACVLGMGCKEVMVTAPLIVLWYDRAFVASSWREIVVKRKYYYASLAATWGVLAWAILHCTKEYTGGSLISVEGLTPWTYLLSQAGVIVHYLRLCFWPQGQCLDYGWPVVHSPREVLLQAAIIGGLLGATIWCIFRHPKWSFIGGWFFLVLAPTSSIVPIKDLAFEHRMYLPLAAVAAGSVLTFFSVVFAIAANRHISSAGREMVCLSLAAGTIAVLGGVAYSRNRVYASETALWNDVVQTSPLCSRGWGNLGTALRKEGHRQQARLCLERAIQIDPRNASARSDLGGLMVDQGHYQSALMHLDRALQDNPTLQEGHVNLAHALRDLGHFSDAVKHYEIARSLRSDDDNTLVSLAGALVPLGRVREAEQLCMAVLARQPASSKARVNLAFAVLAQGRVSEAVPHFQEALRIDPDSAEAHAGIAQVLADSDREAALKHMAEALRLKPTSPNMNLGMGNVIARTNPREAVNYFEAALRAQPEYPEALFNLANAWVECGHPEKAIVYLEAVVKLTPEWTQAQTNLRILRQQVGGRRGN